MYNVFTFSLSRYTDRHICNGTENLNKKGRRPYGEASKWDPDTMTNAVML